MNDEKPWEDWTPPWATHVKGRYEKRVFDEDGLPEPQRVECHCEKCGADWQTVCASGLVRDHINRFAYAHSHGDPLAAPTIVRPGSVRRSVLDAAKKREGR